MTTSGSDWTAALDVDSVVADSSKPKPLQRPVNSYPIGEVEDRAEWAATRKATELERIGGLGSAMRRVVSGWAKDLGIPDDLLSNESYWTKREKA